MKPICSTIYEDMHNHKPTLYKVLNLIYHAEPQHGGSNPLSVCLKKDSTNQRT